jgi:hypothetical protein
MHSNQLPAATQILVANGTLGALTATDQRIDNDPRAADGAHGLVTKDERRDSRARAAFVCVHVRAADAREFDLDNDLVRAGCRLWLLAVLDASSALPNERLHASSSMPPRRGVRASLSTLLTTRR